MPNWTITNVLDELFINFKNIKILNKIEKKNKNIPKCESFGYHPKTFKRLTHIPIFCAESGFSINHIGRKNNKINSAYVDVFPIGDKYIIKYLQNNNSSTDQELKGFIFNLLLYNYLKKTNINLLNYICRVLQIGYIYENNIIYCIMNKCGINLKFFFKENIDKLRSLSYFDKIIFLLNLIKQCAIAIKIIHDLDYVHLDIKFENFLIVLKSGNINDYQIKIIDFGSILKKNTELKSSRGSINHINKIMKNNIKKYQITLVRNFFDIYSLGIMFLKIIKIIFNESESFNKILNNFRKNILETHGGFFNNTFGINDNISLNIHVIIDKMTTDIIENRYNNIDDLIKDINNLLEVINKLRQNMY